MDVEKVRGYCKSLPAVTEKLQWDDALCFKVHDKMFAVLGLDRIRLTFKCTPEAFAELIEHEDIRPSPYLGRHNWVMLDRLDAIRWDELQDLIRHSYEMAAAKAPSRARQKQSAKGRKISLGTRRRKTSSG